MLKEAKYLLCAGGVVVLPTDTVYGLAAHPAFPSAVARLHTLKGRPADKPIAMLAADVEAVRTYVKTLPGTAEKMARAFWPGALTLVLPCGDGYEGFRVPDDPFLCGLLSDCGGVLRVTSANLSGEPPALNAKDALNSVGKESDLVIDRGPSPGGVASTVVKVEQDGSWKILRDGPVGEADIRACLAEK